MNAPVFFHDDFETEFEATERIVRDLSGPGAEGALGQLLSRLRTADDDRKVINLRTGSLPWASQALRDSASVVVYGETLDLISGDVLEVRADWRLAPYPQALRDRRNRWVCERVQTTIVVVRDDAVVDEFDVPLFSPSLTSTLALSVPSTIPCVVEMVASLISPKAFDEAVRREGDALSTWHELHRDRARRLANWQLVQARSSRSVGRDSHRWSPPADLFVSDTPVATRPRGRTA